MMALRPTLGGLAAVVACCAVRVLWHEFITSTPCHQRRSWCGLARTLHQVSVHPSQAGEAVVRGGLARRNMRAALLPGGVQALVHFTIPLERSPMLWTIAVILLVLWALGLVTSTTMGGFVHLLLVIAIIVVLIRVIQGRRVV